MGHGNKIPTIKASKNPMRNISEIVKERTLEEKVNYLLQEFAVLKIQIKGIKQQLTDILNDLATKKWGK